MKLFPCGPNTIDMIESVKRSNAKARVIIRTLIDRYEVMGWQDDGGKFTLKARLLP